MATTYSSAPPAIAADDPAPVVHRIGLADLGAALQQGWDDFKAVPSHAVMLVLIDRKSVV